MRQIPNKLTVADIYFLSCHWAHARSIHSGKLIGIVYKLYRSFVMKLAFLEIIIAVFNFIIKNSIEN